MRYSEFAGCVAYVLREDKASLLAAEGVSSTPEEMAEQFELQTLLNDKACKLLTEKYGLYVANGKKHVNTERLRPHDKAKYDIYEALKQELPKVTSWEQLREDLHKQGIMTEFKYSWTGGRVEGVKFIKGKHVFSGSKIDRKFSFVNIEKRLERNRKFKEKYQQQYQQRQHTECPYIPPRPKREPIQREEPKPRYEESTIENIATGIGSLFTPSSYDATAAQDAAFEAELRRKKKKKRGIRI